MEKGDKRSFISKSRFKSEADCSHEFFDSRHERRRFCLRGREGLGKRYAGVTSVNYDALLFYFSLMRYLWRLLVLVFASKNRSPHPLALWRSIFGWFGISGDGSAPNS